ncbi:unnamed protein product, partial [Amoebophrya sp. A120]|eukprot:GSA120T00009493001.1
MSHAYGDKIGRAYVAEFARKQKKRQSEGIPASGVNTSGDGEQRQQLPEHLFQFLLNASSPSSLPQPGLGHGASVVKFYIAGTSDDKWGKMSALQQAFLLLTQTDRTMQDETSPAPDEFSETIKLLAELLFHGASCPLW